MARVELTELRSSPGLYLFVPLILLQTLGTALVAVGFLDTPLLITSGHLRGPHDGHPGDLPLLAPAVLHGRVARAGAIDPAGGDRLRHPDPHRIALPGQEHRACWRSGWRSSWRSALAGVIAILIQGKVGLELRPFLLVWGLLLAPTVLVWTAFVMAVHTITQNRYTTYALVPGSPVLHGLSRC